MFEAEEGFMGHMRHCDYIAYEHQVDPELRNLYQKNKLVSSELLELDRVTLTFC